MSAVVSSPDSLDSELPKNRSARLALARERLRQAAARGMRVIIYEIALGVDMSEFDFSRRFREAFGYSPHAFYDEVRAARGRDLLLEGQHEGDVARSIGLRRPAELRRLLEKRSAIPSMADVS